jgi:hypothetical protein
LESDVVGPNFFQPALHHLKRQLRAIAFPAQVRKEKVLQFGRHNLFGHVRGGFIAKVAMPAQNPLFKAPGAMRAILQEFDIVV